MSTFRSVLLASLVLATPSIAQSISAIQPFLDREIAAARRAVEVTLQEAAPGSSYCLTTWVAGPQGIVLLPPATQPGCPLIAPAVGAAVQARAAADGAEFPSVYFGVEQRQSGTGIRYFAVPAVVAGRFLRLPVAAPELTASGSALPGSTLTFSVQHPSPAIAPVSFAISTGLASGLPQLPALRLAPSTLVDTLTETAPGRVDVPIANVPSLSGAVFFVQSIAVTSNPLSRISVSDALQVTLQ